MTQERKAKENETEDIKVFFIGLAVLFSIASPIVSILFMSIVAIIILNEKQEIN